MSFVVDWVEKHMPKTLEDFILTDVQYEMMDNWLRHPDKMPGKFLFSGPVGIGKTTAAYLLATASDAKPEEVDCGTTSINDIVRLLISPSLSRFLHDQNGGVDSIILDEYQALTAPQQQKLVKVLETCNKRVFITTNNIDKVLPPIQSRCTKMRFVAKNADELEQIKKRAVKVATKILKAEKIKFAKKDVDIIVEDNIEIDKRTMIRNLQVFTKWWDKKDSQGRIGELVL